jgi:hypothetical protein
VPVAATSCTHSCRWQFFSCKTVTLFHYVNEKQQSGRLKSWKNHRTSDRKKNGFVTETAVYTGPLASSTGSVLRRNLRAAHRASKAGSKAGLQQNIFSTYAKLLL